MNEWMNEDKKKAITLSQWISIYEPNLSEDDWRFSQQ